MGLEVLPSGGGGGSGVTTAATYIITTSATLEGAGAISIALSGSQRVRAVASAPAGFTMNVRITDLTAGNVEKLLLTTTSATPDALTGTFTPADGTVRTYAVEIRLTGGAPTASDRGICYGVTIAPA